MKKFYAILLGFTAVLLAATAAYFSVFGLSKLFIGASISVIIMAGTLEFSKIIIVSFLHQYWNKLAKGLKSYLLIGTVVLMVVTSIGIYGFLSSAYSKSSADIKKMDGDIELLDSKIKIKTEEKVRLDEQIKTKNDRIVSLTNLRESQETRLDSLYQKGWLNSAKQTELVISDANKNIESLNAEISDINIKIESVNDSISKYETIKIETANGNLAGEVGPLKYIAKLTGSNMDKVVNWLILLLILVFDPLAVALVISTSSMIKMIKEEDSEKSNDNNKLNLIEENIVEVASTGIVENSTIEAVENIEEPLNKENDTELTEMFNEVVESLIDNAVVEETNEPLTKTFDEAVVEEINEPLTKNTEESIIKTEDVVIINEKSTKHSLYLNLLNLLYENGKKAIGEEIISYSDLRKSIEAINPELSEKDIKDFLLVCNLFKITEFENGIGRFGKDFNEASFLMSKV